MKHWNTFLALWKHFFLRRGGLLKGFFIPCLCKNPFLVLQNGQKSVIKNQNLCSMGTNIQFLLPKRKLLESPYHIEDFTYLYHPHVVYTSYKNLWWKKWSFWQKASTLRHGMNFPFKAVLNMFFRNFFQQKFWAFEASFCQKPCSFGWR